MRCLAFGLLLVFLIMACAPALAQSAGEDTLTLSFVGDMSIGEMYQQRGRAGSYTRTVDEKGFEWPFSLVRKYLDADDVTVGNLEVVFTTLKKHKDKDINLLADPKYASVLLHSGVDVVNTANNHSYDFGTAGYEQSMKTLDEAGIPHFGTVDPDAGDIKDKLLIHEVKGIRIGFLGFTYPQNSDQARIAKRIKTLRDAGCQLVIVSLHWGREVHATPNVGQYAYAKKIIDAGADAVYGQHPHILQPIHIYKGKPIFYSTGNFTFGSMSKVDPDTGIFLLRYHMTESGPVLENLTVIPCRTQGKGDFRPYELTEEKDRAKVFSKLVFKKEAEGMKNLPASFLEAGSVDFVNGEMVP